VVAAEPVASPPPRSRGVPAYWFVIAVAVAVVFAGVSVALALTRSNPGSAAPLPGVKQTLVNVNGLATGGYYEVEFNVTSPSNQPSNVSVAAVILTNLSCQSPSSPYGPYCDYFLFECPCNVEYVNYTWLDVPIIGTFATNSTTLAPGGYELGINAVSGHPPLAVGHVDLTLSVQLLQLV
jgi:hypothetical protein